MTNCSQNMFIILILIALAGFVIYTVNQKQERRRIKFPEEEYPENYQDDYDYENYSNRVYSKKRPMTAPDHDLTYNYRPLFNYHTRGLPTEPIYLGNLVEIRLNDNQSNLSCQACNLGYNLHMAPKPLIPSPPYPYGHNPQLPSVIQLMGNQKYPNSDRYDYFVLLPSGNNEPIKYSINSYRNQEIMDGDRVVILGKGYIFKKNKL